MKSPQYRRYYSEREKKGTRERSNKIKGSSSPFFLFFSFSLECLAIKSPKVQRSDSLALLLDWSAAIAEGYQTL